MSKKLTQERLKELLHYDPETGSFIWETSRQCVRRGQIAGNINGADGYRRIMVDAKTYKASRLAFLYMEGYFPEYQVDHKNRIRHDDRWKNLRHASHQCNVRNSNTRKDNRSGISGVHWHKQAKKWKTEITVSGKKFSLGYFNSKLDAARARWEAEVKHGFPNCNTTSSAYLYIQNVKNSENLSAFS